MKNNKIILFIAIIGIVFGVITKLNNYKVLGDILLATFTLVWFYFIYKWISNRRTV